jgi:hypothetical protein
MITILAVTLAVVGCGGVSSSQEVARDKATKASCDWYASCSEIGAGKTYPTRADCDVNVRAGWNNAWPSAECDGKIDQAQLDVCLTSISITECANGLDVLNTLVVKCPKASICAGP